MSKSNQTKKSQSSIRDKIMNQITSEVIQPKPRYNFIIKESIIWMLCLLTLVIGALATSVIIFLIQNNDWDVYENLSDNLTEFTVLTLPYLWIIILIFLVGLINTGIKNTQKGYRFNPAILLSITIILSTILGSILFYQGMGYKIDRIINENAPSINRYMNNHTRTWSRPHAGFLAGQIHNVSNNFKFTIIDLNKKNWSIMINNDYARNPHKLNVGERIRLIGEQQDDGTFIAWKLMPTKFKGCPFHDITQNKQTKQARFCSILQN